MYLKTQNFLVAGISRSGFSAAKLLLSHGAKTYVYDENFSPSVEKNTEELKKLGAIVVSEETLSTVRETCDVLVLSPGIPIDHSLPVSFRKAGKKIIGEMELGALFLKANVVAVTGTNGKTTTVGMIEEILKTSGKNVVSCGNVGKPLCDYAETLGYDDIAVIEVSSFQLESLSSLKTHVASVLNITEDHLNRHYTMENYIFLKSRILKNCTESEFAVLNHDDETVRGFAEKTKAHVLWFSMRERVDGAYFCDGYIYWKGEKIIAVANLPVNGKHNVANTLAAVCAAKAFGTDDASLRTGLQSFRGIRHRVEKIAEVNGVSYINDSKATNVDAVIKALDGVRGEIVLLLGGKDKGYDYDKLFSYMKRSDVIHAILYGENRFKLLNAAVKTGYDRTVLCPDFEMAVRFSFVIAKRGQCVLLSPASASFDEFSGYEDRGDRFASLVKEYEASVCAGLKPTAEWKQPPAENAVEEFENGAANTENAVEEREE